MKIEVTEETKIDNKRRSKIKMDFNPGQLMYLYICHVTQD